MPDFNKLQRRRHGDSRRAAGHALRAGGLAEAELGGFLQPQLRLRHLPQLAGEADFAEKHHLRDRSARPAAAEISAAATARSAAGSRHAQAAGDVQIHVVHRQLQPAARLQHRQQHRQPPGIPADHRAPRRAAGIGRQQHLDFHQHRARAFQPGEHRAARDIAAPLGQEQRRRVGDLAPAPRRSSRTRRSHRWRRSGFSRRAECGTGGRDRLRNAAPHRPCAPARAARPARPPWSHARPASARSLASSPRGSARTPPPAPGSRCRARNPRRPSTSSGSSRSPPAPHSGNCVRLARMSPSWVAAASCHRRAASSPAARRAAGSGRSIPRRKYTAPAARPAPSAAPACSSSVDLPMPGSPPTSTTEAGTSPPPSTRSNSAIVVGTRGGGGEMPASPTNSILSTARPPLAFMPPGKAGSGGLLLQRIPRAAGLAAPGPFRETRCHRPNRRRSLPVSPSQLGCQPKLLARKACKSVWSGRDQVQRRKRR